MELILLIIIICVPALILSWTLPEKWQLLPLIITTCIFIGIESPISLVILLTTTSLNYYSLQYYNSTTTVTLVTITLLSSIFLFFKVSEGALLSHRIIPLGLSYYTFRQIHYTIEAYKKKLPRHTLLEYIQYQFFLPVILIGPIHRFDTFLKDYKRRRWNNQHFAEGLERILYGLFKIAFVGNFLLTVKLTDLSSSLSVKYVWLSTYLDVIDFTANAYIQFSGFSDIAIGLSLLFGFRITENFNFPFLAQNISDFWRRWHMSLSNWCKDYVFIPFLSISRSLLISAILTMLVLGLWHEISFRYILWGTLHAVAINVWNFYEKSSLKNQADKLPLLQKFLGIFITFHFVVFSFIIVSEESLNESLEIFKTLLLIQ